MDLSTLDARKALVAKWATKYGLAVDIVCAVCEQESSWNPWAMRFEPGFLRHYVKPKDPANPTTNEIAQATSWGLLQIMGGVALEFGFTGRFMSQLCDPDVGVDFGCRKLQKCFDTHKDAETSLLAYNGGGNPDYGKQVLARTAKYGEGAGSEGDPQTHP